MNLKTRLEVSNTRLRTVIAVVVDKLIHKAIQGEKFHATETAFLAIAMFAAGLLISIPTPATGYQTACEDLYKTVSFNYTGSIDEYNPEYPTDLYASSLSQGGGVLLASSNQLTVEKGTRLNFSFTEEVTVTCNSTGQLDISTYIFDETLQNASQRYTP